MSGAVTDVRDVLGIEVASEPRQPPVKKLKTTVEKRPDGITRELYALLGENAPPVAVIEQRFKEKPRFFGKVTPWKFREFTNPARSDGLKLQHWVRQSDNDDGEEPLESMFHKFNVKIDVAEYTDQEYEAALKDPEWPKEETDYLFDLLREYDLRWIVVADRYEWGVPDPDVKKEQEDGDEAMNKEGEQQQQQKPQRTMEDLKARYYFICKRLMEFRGSVANMSDEDLKYYNSLKFDKAQEAERKRILKVQLSRTVEDMEKERNLIHELKRISENHQQMLEEREDLFNRLDFPASTGSIAAYQSSAGLAQLAANLIATDRSKKRKSIAAQPGAPGAEAGAAASPTVPTQKEKDAAEPEKEKKEKEPPAKSESKHHRNESVSKASETAETKSSSTKDSRKKEKEKDKEPVVRMLTAAEEKTYNVTHHEKLQQGVWVRSQKMTLPKGHGYNPKYINLMTELGIPPALTMPTLKNCAKYEALCAEVGILWDLRKSLEKVEHETKVFEKQEALARADEGGGGAPKRSASVMSDTSKAAKKPKKDK